MVFDGLYVLLTLFATALVATYAPLHPGLVVLVCGGAIAAVLTQRPNLFAIVLVPLVAYVLRWVDIAAVMRRFILASAGLFALVVSLYSLTGFNRAKDVVVWRAYTGDFMVRLSVGFSHPNRAMMEWSIIAIAILAFTSARGRVRWALPILAVTWLLFAGTDSRTSTALVVGFTVIALLQRKTLDGPVSRATRLVAIIAPLFFTISAFVLPRLTGGQLDSLLSGRPAVYASLLEDYSLLSIFGHGSVEEGIVDNGYLQMFLSKGPLLAVLYLTILMILIALPARLSRRTVVLLGVFLVSAVFETTLLSFAHLLLVLTSLEMDRRSPNGELP
ncbi:hypothetical protein [Blastococcus sp. SYSU DS0617]